MVGSERRPISPMRHDQLPHLEEARHWVARSDSSRNDGRRRTYLRVLWAGAFGVLVVLAVSLAISLSPNEKPTGKPLQSRFDKVVTYLSDYSDPVALRTKGTPQYLAARWMADDDPLAYEIPDSNIYDGHHFRQRFALTVFYYATGGEEWREAFNFLSGTNECYWNVISKAHDIPVPYGVTCDDEQDIVTIVSGGNNLLGHLPSELALLTSLNFLWIPDNGIISLPDELQTLTRMDAFNIDRNRIQQEIPKWIQSWQQMTFLSMQHNRFTGTIPTEFGKLSMMMRLQLTGNQLSGNVPSEFLGMKDLQYLLLGHNELEGEIEPWLASDLEEFFGLDLRKNNFTGSLPDALGKLTTLERLYLDSNQLSGDISILNSLPDLEALFVQDNYFFQSIDSVADLLTGLANLQAFDGSRNSFFGRLESTDLLTHETLRILDLHGNDLSGGIPSLLQDNPVLEYLSLHSNSMTQHIPEAISRFVALRHLDLSSNSLEGNLTTELGDLTKLTHLLLAENSFTPGKIPDSLNSLTDLQVLSLRDTQLTGPIAKWIGELKSLSLLNLERNRLSGSIPGALGDAKSLKYLLLNENQLNGTVPSSIQHLPQLSYLLMGENNLTGIAGYVCDGDSLVGELEQVFADCGGDTPEILCPCCTVCCLEDGAQCNGNDELALPSMQTTMYDRTDWDISNDLEDIF